MSSASFVPVSTASATGEVTAPIITYENLERFKMCLYNGETSEISSLIDLPEFQNAPAEVAWWLHRFQGLSSSCVVFSEWFQSRLDERGFPFLGCSWDEYPEWMFYETRKFLDCLYDKRCILP